MLHFTKYRGILLLPTPSHLYTLYNQHLVDPLMQLLFEVYISKSALPSCTDTTPTGHVLQMLGIVGMENHLPTSEIFWEY